MIRDIKIVSKEIDCFGFFNKLNSYNVKLDLDVKTWDDVVLKIFPKLNLFNSKLLKNKQITSLNGSPKEVYGNFDCSENYLNSLEGSPLEVWGNFICSNNQLISLNGSPLEVGGIFNCSHNQLTSLEGAPYRVDLCFTCLDNPDLPEYKIKAYKAYLKLSDSKKVPLTKDGHYFPTEEWENMFK